MGGVLTARVVARVGGSNRSSAPLPVTSVVAVAPVRVARQRTLTGRGPAARCGKTWENGCLGEGANDDAPEESFGPLSLSLAVPGVGRPRAADTRGCTRAVQAF